MSYVELHCHSGFSFLDGASHIDELVQRATELDYPALALTDHDGLYGSMEFAHAARERELYPITGAELTLRESFLDECYATSPSSANLRDAATTHHVTLLAES